MALQPPTEEQMKYILNQLNMTPESLEKDVKYLKEWLSQQPHLPHQLDERIFRSALFARKNSLEKVKESVDLCYTVKSLAPDLFGTRDPLDPALKDYIDKQFCYPFPKLTPDGSRVCLFRLMDMDASQFVFTKSAKLILMTGVVMLMEDTCLNWVVIIDLRGITLGHLTTATIPLIKKFLFISQKAYPIRPKAIHLIYAPPYVDALVGLFKPFLKKKLAERIFIHPGGLGGVFDTVPRSIFPDDYGGDDIPLRQMHENWKKKLTEYKEWFSREDQLRADESRRPGKPQTHDNIFGFEGSFRQLSVD